MSYSIFFIFEFQWSNLFDAGLREIRNTTVSVEKDGSILISDKNGFARVSHLEWKEYAQLSDSDNDMTMIKHIEDDFYKPEVRYFSTNNAYFVNYVVSRCIQVDNMKLIIDNDHGSFFDKEDIIELIKTNAPWMNLAPEQQRGTDAR